MRTAAHYYENMNLNINFKYTLRTTFLKRLMISFGYHIHENLSFLSLLESIIYGIKGNNINITDKKFQKLNTLTRGKISNIFKPAS